MVVMIPLDKFIDADTVSGPLSQTAAGAGHRRDDVRWQVAGFVAEGLRGSAVDNTVPLPART